MPRYARQEAIPGWDQDRLTGATLAIAGSGGGPTRLRDRRRHPRVWLAAG